MASIFERFAFEVSTTDSVTDVEYAVLNFEELFGLTSTQRFTARCMLRCWSYNSSALDAEGSSSYGAYDTSEELVFNRDPNLGTFGYVPQDTGDPDSPSAEKVHVRGRTDMLTSLAVNPGSPDSARATFLVRGGAATTDLQTIQHLIVVEIELFK